MEALPAEVLFLVARNLCIWRVNALLRCSTTLAKKLAPVMKWAFSRLLELDGGLFNEMRWERGLEWWNEEPRPKNLLERSLFRLLEEAWAESTETGLKLRELLI